MKTSQQLRRVRKALKAQRAVVESIEGVELCDGGETGNLARRAVLVLECVEKSLERSLNR